MYNNNRFCDKLIQLRKERGLSQEQLADQLEVSRQAVSKWEGDQSMPSLDKIIQIADMFEMSVDYLIRDAAIGENVKSSGYDKAMGYDKSLEYGKAMGYDKSVEYGKNMGYDKSTDYNKTMGYDKSTEYGKTMGCDKSMDSEKSIDHNKKYESNFDSTAVLSQLNEITQMVHRKYSDVYEYKSKRVIHGIPLVHIKFSRYGKPCVAKGIIAIGSISVGVISLGAISAGILSFGALSLGLLLAVGAICLGSISFGAVSIGLFACGGVAIGMYAFGGVALASKVAVGGAASATIAIGDAVSGDQTFDIAVATKEGVKQAIQETYPNIPKSILRFILMAIKR